MKKPVEIDYPAFLSTSLFYPASDLDTTPLLHTPTPEPIRNFVYADYGVGPNNEIIGNGDSCPFAGFKVMATYKLQPEAVLGLSWRELRAKYERITPQAFDGNWSAPCIYFFKLLPRKKAVFSRPDDPELIQLLFIRLEGVAVYRELYIRRQVAPICLANTRIGSALGGEFPGYRALLSTALRENRAGLPKYLLNEEGLSTPLPIADEYEIIQHLHTVVNGWNDKQLTLRRLKSQVSGSSLQQKG